jgi:hypothetical protein
MIAAVSPCASSSDHTVNTLRYADRVKEKHVAADAFDGAAVVDPNDISFESDANVVIHSPRRDGKVLDFPDDDGPEDNISSPVPSDSISSQDDIKLLHHSLRIRSDSVDKSADFDIENLHGVVNYNKQHYRQKYYQLLIIFSYVPP